MEGGALFRLSQSDLCFYILSVLTFALFSTAFLQFYSNFYLLGSKRWQILSHVLLLYIVMPAMNIYT